MNFTRFSSFILIVSLLALTACSSSTSLVEDAPPGQTAEAGSSGNTPAENESQSAENAEGSKNVSSQAEETSAEASPGQIGKIIKKSGKVQDRGVYVKMIVNRNAITNSDLNRRVKFLELRRVGGNRKQVAEREMIEQILKLQEAKRQSSLASDEMVETAFANFAKGNRTNASQLASELNRIGIGAAHFKDFIKTQISWQNAVSRRYQAQTVRVSERDVAIQLRDSGGDKPQLTEFSFQQIVFVVPKAKQSKSSLAARRKEANAMRQHFTSCENTIGLAKQLRDVSVIERARILDPELPKRWRDDMSGLKQNETTPVKDTEKGVEFIAVCNARLVNDDRAAQIAIQAEKFENFDTKETSLSQDYLATLKSNATIIYQ